MGHSRRMRSVDRMEKRWIRHLVMLAMVAALAAASLACSIGAGGQVAPVFVAPGGGSLPTAVVQVTPEPGAVGGGEAPAPPPETIDPTALVASSVAAQTTP